MTSKSEFVIRGDCTVYWQNNLSMNGDLIDFFFVENTKALREALNDPELMKKLMNREITFVQLEQVVCIDIKHPRVILPETG